MSRMNLPARRVSWDGGRMMTWQVGETKTETVFVFIVHPHSLSITPETIHTYYFAHFMHLPLAQLQYF